MGKTVSKTKSKEKSVFMNSTPDKALRCLYEQAVYIVNEDAALNRPVFQLRVGGRNYALEKWMSKQGHSFGIYITACNPRSRVLSELENQQRTKSLEQIVEQLGFEIIKGYSTDSKGTWPKEISYLVVGAELALGRLLAEEFGQMAFLWIEAGQSVALIVSDCD